MGIANGDFKSGTFSGTGSAINVELGFVPDYVKVFNLNDAGTLAPVVEWTSGMADDHGYKSLSITDSGSTGKKSTALITSGGISVYDGDDTHAAGFTIGTDSDLNASGEDGVWIAFRNS